MSKDEIHQINEQRERRVPMIDKYTKVVLTVIAVCLLWLCFTLTVNPVSADDVVNVNIERVGGYRLLSDVIKVECQN